MSLPSVRRAEEVARGRKAMKLVPPTEIARRYGVTLEVLPNGEEPLVAPAAPRSGYWCDPDLKTVYVWKEHVPLIDIGYHAAAFLHEVVHCIVQPPKYSIYSIPEDWILLPFERCLFRQTQTGSELTECLDYQKSTQYETWGRRGAVQLSELVGDYKRPESTPTWREGLARARKVGLLDDRNRVTWKRPRWSRLNLVRELGRP